MPLFTIVVGAVLVALGAGAFLAAPADARSVTALIPAFVGAPIALCGGIALARHGARKHAMHLVAVLALLGFLAPLGRLIPGMLAENFEFEPLKHGTMLAMSVLCLVLLVACVRSFVQARRQRATA